MSSGATPGERYHEELRRLEGAASLARSRHGLAVAARLLVLVATIAVASLLPGAVAAGLLGGGGLFAVLTGVILRLETKLERLASHRSYYEAGLARLEERWMEGAVSGEAYFDAAHPYAADLDLIGRGGLFGLLCVAQTAGGKERLARWLGEAASPAEVARRQEAVRELAGQLTLRQTMWAAGANMDQAVNAGRLGEWVTAPAEAAPRSTRYLAAAFGAAAAPALALALAGHLPWALVLVAAQAALAWRYRRLVDKVQAAAAHRARELRIVASVVESFAEAELTAPALIELAAAVRGELGVRRSVLRLVRLVEWMDARRNPYFAMVTAPLLLGTQLALAIEAWRARHAELVQRWIEAVSTLEALASLATFAFEHPGYVFPRVDGEAQQPYLRARGLGHPLLAAATRVCNDVELGERRLLLVTGSNMSGKSTFLRAIGVNAVLAQAGAPVCAQELKLSPLAVAATIRTADSLQEGISRFFAEIRRLRDVLAQAKRTPFTLFLLDEVLAGTNSHDRQRGGEAIVRTLLESHAVGLITTHDLALAHLAESLPACAMNVHFEDRVEEGRLVFDFTLRSGIVSRSNALELMRLVGIDV